MIDAIRNGMTPCINQMALIGLVSIPGMMTGNIISGTDPLLAAKYQMVIMFLIAAASSIGILISLMLLMNIVFDDEDRLTVQRLNKRTAKSQDIVTSFVMSIWEAAKWCGVCCRDCCCSRSTSTQMQQPLLQDGGETKTVN